MSSRVLLGEAESLCQLASMCVSTCCVCPVRLPSQWKPDEEPGPQAWPARDRAALEEELSDVLIYLVALAARCRVDLPRAVLSKMDTNRRRYPVHLSRGSARKYTDLGQEAASEDQAPA